MPSLNTRTQLAIIGMTVDWCSISLRLNLHRSGATFGGAAEKWMVGVKVPLTGSPNLFSL